MADEIGDDCKRHKYDVGDIGAKLRYRQAQENHCRLFICRSNWANGYRSWVLSPFTYAIWHESQYNPSLCTTRLYPSLDYVNESIVLRCALMLWNVFRRGGTKWSFFTMVGGWTWLSPNDPWFFNNFMPSSGGSMAMSRPHKENYDVNGIYTPPTSSHLQEDTCKPWTLHRSV